ncbi:Uncharacterised protein [Vibrio cholerae]|nr:Uncharacterised protein [Vibrio cholerae]
MGCDIGQSAGNHPARQCWVYDRCWQTWHRLDALADAKYLLGCDAAASRVESQ